MLCIEDKFGLISSILRGTLYGTGAGTQFQLRYSLDFLGLALLLVQVSARVLLLLVGTRSPILPSISSISSPNCTFPFTNTTENYNESYYKDNRSYKYEDDESCVRS